MEENNLGRDERLLVLGTQTRLRYGYGVAGACPSLPEPVFRLPRHSHIPTFQFEVIGKKLI